MNSKATKAALITSLTSLVLCFTMLTGTTLAWFVDRVESTNNRIEACNLEVDLVMLKGNEYVSIANGSGDLFAESEGTNSIPWQPNMTKTIYLGIQNKGSLAIKYEATIDVKNGGLLGVLDYSITDFGITPPIGGIVAANVDSSRSGMIESTAQSLLLGKGILEEVTEEDITARQLSEGETHYYAFTVHMANNASQQYQNQTISLEIQVKATQANFNEDSDDTSDDSLVLSPDDEKVTTLSETSWKLKKDIADYSFLEKTEGEDENEDIIFPDETTISNGDNTYPLSTLRVIPLDGSKLLAAVPVENAEAGENAEGATEKTPEQSEKVFVYIPKSTNEETVANDAKTEKTSEEKTDEDIFGWYLIGFKDFQKLISNETPDIIGVFISENKITNAESLPVITLPKKKDDILKNEDLINWITSSTEKTETDKPLS